MQGPETSVDDAGIRILVEHARQVEMDPADNITEISQKSRVAKIFAKRHGGQQRSQDQGRQTDFHRQRWKNAKPPEGQKDSQAPGTQGAPGHEESAQSEEDRKRCGPNRVRPSGSEKFSSRYS